MSDATKQGIRGSGRLALVVLLCMAAALSAVPWNRIPSTPIEAASYILGEVVPPGRPLPTTLSSNERYCQNVEELMAAVGDQEVSAVYLDAVNYVLTKAISLDRDFSFYGPETGTAFLVSRVGYRHIIVTAEDTTLTFEGVVLDGRGAVTSGSALNGGIEIATAPHTATLKLPGSYTVTSSTYFA